MQAAIQHTVNKQHLSSPPLSQYHNLTNFVGFKTCWMCRLNVHLELCTKSILFIVEGCCPKCLQWDVCLYTAIGVSILQTRHVIHKFISSLFFFVFFHPVCESSFMEPMALWSQAVS